MKNWLGREPEINDLQTENLPVRPITGLVLTWTILQLNELHAEITCGVSLFMRLPTRQPLYTIRRLNQSCRTKRTSWRLTRQRGLQYC